MIRDPTLDLQIELLSLSKQKFIQICLTFNELMKITL